MQEELNEFELLGVWELVPRPDKVMVITLKWIYKAKLRTKLGEYSQEQSSSLRSQRHAPLSPDYVTGPEHEDDEIVMREDEDDEMVLRLMRRQRWSHQLLPSYSYCFTSYCPVLTEEDWSRLMD
ncbi:hypothetical protein Tco_1531426 [Tanacetum coccineum]